MESIFRVGVLDSGIDRNTNRASYQIKVSRSRTGRNPFTGEEIPIAAKRMIRAIATTINAESGQTVAVHGEELIIMKESDILGFID